VNSIPEVRQRLVVGDIAPAFCIKDIDGNTVDLSALRGQPVLLSFFRNSACALCNLRVHEMIGRFDEWTAHGLRILTVFESPAESIREYVGQQRPPFPIIADPGEALYNLYHVEVSEEKLTATMIHIDTPQRIAEASAQGFQLIQQPESNFNRIPADFLIGTDGSIHSTYYAERVGEHLSFAVIDDFLAGA
jgi:thioredoxin-dependent peroxiredoxin